MSKNQCDAISNWNLYLPRKKWNQNLCDEVFCRVVGDAKDLCTGHQRARQKRPFVQSGARIEANRRTVKQKVHVQMTPEWNSGRKFSPEKSWCPTVWGWRQSKTGPGWHKSSKLQRACDTLCWCRISPDRVLLESHLMITCYDHIMMCWRFLPVVATRFHPLRKWRGLPSIRMMRRTRTRIYVC